MNHWKPACSSLKLWQVSVAPVPGALCLAQWEAKPEGNDVPRPALKDLLLFSFQLRSLLSQTGRAPSWATAHQANLSLPQPSPCGPSKQTRPQCLCVYTPTCGSGYLLSVGCDLTSQDATVHLLNLQLPVFSYFVLFSICKWHFSGTEGGPGPQVCFLSPLALPAPIKVRSLWCACSAGLRREVRGKGTSLAALLR